MTLHFHQEYPQGIIEVRHKNTGVSIGYLTTKSTVGYPFWVYKQTGDMWNTSLELSQISERLLFLNGHK